jgi:hypothetical protein
VIGSETVFAPMLMTRQTACASQAMLFYRVSDDKSFSKITAQALPKVH